MKFGRMAVVALVFLVSACSKSDSGSAPSSEPKTTAATAAGLETACARLDDLANEVLAFQADQSGDEIAKMKQAVEAFDDAASSSGDAELAKQAHLAATGFKAYLQGGAAGQEGSVATDIAIDRAGKRCLETKSIDSLPTEPN